MVCGFILNFLVRELAGAGRLAEIRPKTRDLGPIFRADAKAEGQEVVIGGWECANGTPPATARWFSVKLDRSTAAWAFSRGEPFRNIAAIELYASLVSVMVFCGDWVLDMTGR